MIRDFENGLPQLNSTLALSHTGIHSMILGGARIFAMSSPVVPSAYFRKLAHSAGASDAHFRKPSYNPLPTHPHPPTHLITEPHMLNAKTQRTLIASLMRMRMPRQLPSYRGRPRLANSRGRRCVRLLRSHRRTGVAARSIDTSCPVTCLFECNPTRLARPKTTRTSQGHVCSLMTQQSAKASLRR